MADQDTLTEYCEIIEQSVSLAGFVPGIPETAKVFNFDCDYCKKDSNGYALCEKQGLGECLVFNSLAERVGQLEDIPK